MLALRPGGGGQGGGGGIGSVELELVAGFAGCMLTCECMGESTGCVCLYLLADGWSGYGSGRPSWAAFQLSGHEKARQGTQRCMQ